MKVETNNIYTIFLLKKNIRSDIMKIILEYLSIAIPISLKKLKIENTLVKQEYKPIEGKQDYRTRSEITYRKRRLFINIRKAKDNYNKDRKSRCFNCNVYRHMANDYRKLKKDKETRKCYKYNKVKYFANNCRSE